MPTKNVFHEGQVGVCERVTVPGLVVVVTQEMGIVAAGHPGASAPSHKALTVIDVMPGAGSRADGTVIGPKARLAHLPLLLQSPGPAIGTAGALPTMISKPVRFVTLPVGLQVPPRVTLMVPCTVPMDVPKAYVTRVANGRIIWSPLATETAPPAPPCVTSANVHLNVFTAVAVLNVADISAAV